MKTVEEIFLAAVEKAPADRVAYLDEACGADAELRAQVQDLLRSHEQAGSVLEQPLFRPSPTVDQPPAEQPGTVVGPYKLIEQIGEGGMGTVWMAQQTEPVKRLVALKLIKAGMDSKQVIARFEAERQALALMDHPNIARVLAGGTTQGEPAGVSPGRPYFVMDLVKGVPITKYCDEHHLTPRQRLELFVPICHAIQHAHQKGIIHRDLKPSNVLVALYDGKPVPKVIDFGVAKAAGQLLTDKTLVTGFGNIVGTLEYMSPEQAEINQLDIDTRSDVYALGVLLYELLAGSPPFTMKDLEKAGILEMLRVIREQEPSKPSTKLRTAEGLPTLAANRGTEPAKLTKVVRGELDWIVMKALEKDRNRRYETANGFARDVERYLADEPVQACPPSVGYRLRKFARRNKATLAAAGLVLFFIVLLGGVVGWGMWDRAAREQEIAQETARKLALTEQGIRQALDRGTARRAELHAILKRPGGAQQLLNQAARWELLIKTAQGELAQARQLATRAEGNVDAESTRAMDMFEKQLTNDQADYDLAVRLESIRLDTATWMDGQFDYRTWAEEYAKAFAGFAVLKDDPAAVAARLRSSPIKDLLVAALDQWAWAVHRLREQGLAEHLLMLARQAAPEPAWGDRLRQPQVWGDPEILGKLVSGASVAGLSPQLLSLMGILLHDVDSPLTETWLRQAQAEHPNDFWLSFNLGFVLTKTNPVEAAGFFRVALALRPGTSAAYGNLGVALCRQQHLPEGIAAYHKAIQLNPQDARAYNNVGCALRDLQKLPEAVAAYHKAIEIDPQYAMAYRNLGLALFEQNKRTEAIAACEMAIKLNPRSAWTWSGRGWLHMLSGELDKALADQTKAIELEPKEPLHWTDRSVTYLKLGQLEKSLADSSHAIELRPKFAPAWFNRGEAYRQLGKWEKAAHAYRTAIDLKTLTMQDVRLAHRYLASVLNQMGNKEEARKEYESVVELDRKAVELAPNDAMPWQELGWDQYRAGAWEASIEALEKSCKLQQGGTGDSGQWIVLALAHARLAAKDSLPEEKRAQHRSEARRWYDQAVKQIDTWDHGSDPTWQAIRAFRVQADELIGPKAKKD